MEQKDKDLEVQEPQDQEVKDFLKDVDKITGDQKTEAQKDSAEDFLNAQLKALPSEQRTKLLGKKYLIMPQLFSRGWKSADAKALEERQAVDAFFEEDFTKFEDRFATRMGREPQSLEEIILFLEQEDQKVDLAQLISEPQYRAQAHRQWSKVLVNRSLEAEALGEEGEVHNEVLPEALQRRMQDRRWERVANKLGEKKPFAYHLARAFHRDEDAGRREGYLVQLEEKAEALEESFRIINENKAYLRETIPTLGDYDLEQSLKVLQEEDLDFEDLDPLTATTRVTQIEAKTESLKVRARDKQATHLQSAFQARYQIKELVFPGTMLHSEKVSREAFKASLQKKMHFPPSVLMAVEADFETRSEELFTIYETKYEAERGFDRQNEVFATRCKGLGGIGERYLQKYKSTLESNRRPLKEKQPLLQDFERALPGLEQGMAETEMAFEGVEMTDEMVSQREGVLRSMRESIGEGHKDLSFHFDRLMALAAGLEVAEVEEEVEEELEVDSVEDEEEDSESLEDKEVAEVEEEVTEESLEETEDEEDVDDAVEYEDEEVVDVIEEGEEISEEVTEEVIEEVEDEETEEVSEEEVEAEVENEEEDSESSEDEEVIDDAVKEEEELEDQKEEAEDEEGEMEESVEEEEDSVEYEDEEVVDVIEEGEEISEEVTEEVIEEVEDKETEEVSEEEVEEEVEEEQEVEEEVMEASLEETEGEDEIEEPDEEEVTEEVIEEVEDEEVIDTAVEEEEELEDQEEEAEDEEIEEEEDSVEDEEEEEQEVIEEVENEEVEEEDSEVLVDEENEASESEEVVEEDELLVEPEEPIEEEPEEEELEAAEVEEEIEEELEVDSVEDKDEDSEVLVDEENEASESEEVEEEDELVEPEEPIEEEEEELEDQEEEESSVESEEEPVEEEEAEVEEEVTEESLEETEGEDEIEESAEEEEEEEPEVEEEVNEMPIESLENVENSEEFDENVENLGKKEEEEEPLVDSSEALEEEAEDEEEEPLVDSSEALEEEAEAQALDLLQRIEAQEVAEQEDEAAEVIRLRQQSEVRQVEKESKTEEEKVIEDEKKDVSGWLLKFRDQMRAQNVLEGAGSGSDLGLREQAAEERIEVAVNRLDYSQLLVKLKSMALLSEQEYQLWFSRLQEVFQSLGVMNLRQILSRFDRYVSVLEPGSQVSIAIESQSLGREVDNAENILAGLIWEWHQSHDPKRVSLSFIQPHLRARMGSRVIKMGIEWHQDEDKKLI